MNHSILNYQLWFTTGVLGVIALLFLSLGLRGLITHRPFLFPSRIMFGLMVLAFLPNFFMPFQWMGGNGTHPFDVGMLISPLMFVVILVMFWFQMRGYMVYGVSAEAFRNCLRRTLDKLNLPYQESFSSIRLETVDANLQASVQDWMGTAQLRIKPAKHVNTLTAIATGLREEFLTENARVNTPVFIVYTLLSLLMLGLAIHLAMLHR